jgi:hypothetical protein
MLSGRVRIHSLDEASDHAGDLSGVAVGMATPLIESSL